LTVKRTDNLITSLEDCKKHQKTVGTLVNCAASRLLDQSGYKAKAYQDPVGAYQDLELGRVDAVLMDVAGEMFYARKNPKLKAVGKPFQTGFKAASVTVLLAFGAMMIAVILGLPLAIGQSNGGPVIKAACTVYIEFFRGTPVLVQLLFLYFGLPVIGITLPGWLTAIVGLGLNYAAYESQVYRTAFQAIPKRQWQVAYSLGMRPLLAFRRIIFPQAFRVALPPMTNDFVALFRQRQNNTAALTVRTFALRRRRNHHRQ
jgi:His/Glu/Gln/Arg/opine family amino acid ABC transporter permease subunit